MPTGKLDTNSVTLDLDELKSIKSSKSKQSIVDKIKQKKKTADHAASLKEAPGHAPSQASSKKSNAKAAPAGQVVPQNDQASAHETSYSLKSDLSEKDVIKRESSASRSAYSEQHQDSKRTSVDQVDLNFETRDIPFQIKTENDYEQLVEDYKSQKEQPSSNQGNRQKF